MFSKSLGPDDLKAEALMTVEEFKTLKRGVILNYYYSELPNLCGLVGLLGIRLSKVHTVPVQILNPGPRYGDVVNLSIGYMSVVK